MSLAPSFSPPMVLMNTTSMVEYTGYLHERRRRVTLVSSKASSVRLESMARADYTHDKKKKRVRFDKENLEQVRLFLKTQTPLAIHDGDPSSPLSGMVIEVKYPNWPEKTVIRSTPRTSMIRMESVQVASNSDVNAITLMGRCRVANLAFQKHVVVRYTTDYWQSFHETEAMYREPIGSSSNTWDRFSFQIELDQVHTTTPTTLYLALCYTVNDTDYWDNNDGLNYQLDVMVCDNAAVNEDCQKEGEEVISDRGQHQLPLPLPTPLPTPSPLVDHARHRRKESIQSDRKTSPPAASIAGSAPVSSPRVRSPISKTKVSPTALVIEPPKDVVVAKKKQLGLRYDFGASLSAAKKVVWYPPSSREMPYQHPFVGRRLFEQQHVAPAAEAGNEDDVLQLRYRDIIAKYCFYGNTTTPPPTAPPSMSPCPSPEPICG